MADPVRHSDLHNYLKRAEQALADANSATLENVRERCLRAEAAWRAMAQRAERSEKMRADDKARKQAAL
jgi:hypothetical protein